MAGRFDWKRNLEHLTYDKRMLHKQALRIRRSLDEVNAYLNRKENSPEKGKKNGRNS